VPSSTPRYVTDVTYTPTFTAAAAPAWFDLVALLSAVEPPARRTGLGWCELGCGQGVTAAILAATHPTGRFHGIDLMPEHIAGARRLAKRARIANLTLHACDFAKAASLELPGFDYIVAHGVYSWIDPRARETLRHFIDRHLSLGGQVYISYNAMPGWAADLPFQYLTYALAKQAGGNSIAKFGTAEAALRRLGAAGARSLNNSPIFRRELARQRKHMSLTYFAHEYLAPAWKPLYVTEVRPELATIGLVPVGSALLRNNFDSFVLRQAEREALDEIAEPDLRELIRDYFLQARFRRDVFSRDPAPIDDREQRRRILTHRFALTQPAASVSYAMPTPAGTLHFDSDAGRRIVALLAAGPRTLFGIKGAVHDVVANALALAAAGIIRPVAPDDGPVEALNTALDEIDTEAAPFAARALPCGTALMLEAALRRHLRDGHKLPRRLAAWPGFLASTAGIGRH
jgi:trans-aconitate methyltransferase